ncbi:MAG: glucose-1-phosphate adenylyltransferase [Planctomycetota bacterium]
MRPLDVHVDRSMGNSDALRKTVTMVLAGGKGERLYPLTRHRAKPAVPFAGNFRLIDFTLSNCLNSGLRRVHVLTQYKSDSLNRHIRRGWDVYNPEFGEFIEINPPQMRLTSHWYRGTADAIHENIYTLDRERPDYVLIVSGDHLYRMDYGRLIQQHVTTGADLTIACHAVPPGEASRLGALDVQPNMRVCEMMEKPDDPPAAPEYVRKTGEVRSLCSMGVYVFDTEVLVRRVVEDFKTDTSHDFGRDVIPSMIRAGDDVRAHRFTGMKGEKDPYWRDVGTLDVYWDTHMQLLSSRPPVDLYDVAWPMRTYVEETQPAKTMSCSDSQKEPGCVGDSLLCNRVISEGARIIRSVLGPGVRLRSGSVVEDSIIIGDCDVGSGAVIRKAIVDKNNRIPAGFRLGVNHDSDQQDFTISKGGVVVVPKGMPLFNM